MNVLTITGNPLGLAGPSQYKELENVIVNVLAATLINEKVGSADDNSIIKKASSKRMQQYPYPNPIKLLSRGQKENKGEYLNAEMMHQGIALPISDI